MTVGVFDLTEHTQFSIRKDTGLHPDGLSLGVYIHCGDYTKDTVDSLRAQGVRDIPPEFSCYDAVEWERAVRLAKWILEYDAKLF